MDENRGPFAKVYRALWDGTLGSDWQAWAVFVFMLAHAKRSGEVDMAPAAIAARSGLPLEAVRRGIEELEKVDPESRTAEEDGRRIVRLDEHRTWGWRIVNYERYREMTEAERSAWYRQRHLDEVRERDRERWRRRTPSRGVVESGGGVTERDGTSHTARRGEGRGERQKELSLASPDGEASPVPDPREVTGAAVEEIPLADGTPWCPTVAEVEEWRRLFPGVDVVGQFRAMRAWSLANPAKRKTRRGVRAFVVRWLTDEQDKGGGGRGRGPRAAGDRRYIADNIGGGSRD